MNLGMDAATRPPVLRANMTWRPSKRSFVSELNTVPNSSSTLNARNVAFGDASWTTRTQEVVVEHHSTSHVAEMFDAHLEAQLVYAEYEDVEPRLLELVQRRITKNARLDRGLFIVASLDRNVSRLLRRRRGEFAGLALYLGELGTGSADIRHRMTEVLTAVDRCITVPIPRPCRLLWSNRRVPGDHLCHRTRPIRSASSG